MIAHFQNNFIRDYEIELAKHMPMGKLSTPELSDTSVEEEDEEIDGVINRDSEWIRYENPDRINNSIVVGNELGEESGMNNSMRDLH